MEVSPAAAASYGQVIEYIQGKSIRSQMYETVAN